MADAIQNLIEFPVSFHLPSGKIYDARNFEVACVKTFASNDEARLEIGEFIAESINQNSIQKGDF